MFTFIGQLAPACFREQSLVRKDNNKMRLAYDQTKNIYAYCNNNM